MAWRRQGFGSTYTNEHLALTFLVLRGGLLLVVDEGDTDAFGFAEGRSG